MLSILALTSNNDKGVLFMNPRIKNKDELIFNVSSIGVKDACFKLGIPKISFLIGGAYYDLDIDSKDVQILDKFHKEEFDNANLFFKNLVFKNVNLIISKDNQVCTEELINNSFNPYYVNLFLYQLNKFGINGKDFNEVEGNLLKKIDLTKYDLVSNENGENYIIPLKDIIKK